MNEIEVVKLRQQNILLQAQSLERDVLVREHARLMAEAQELQQTISKMEEKEYENKNKKNPVDWEPVTPPDAAQYK
jgi:hypothetical protein